MSKVNVKVATIRKQYLKQSSTTTFRGKKQPPKRAIVIKKKDKCRIYLNKPIYIGAVILKKAKIACILFTINVLKLNMVLKPKC